MDESTVSARDPNHKRQRSGSPPPWRRAQKLARRDGASKVSNTSADTGNDDDVLGDRRKQEAFAREQTRRNQLQEAEQMQQWVSQEDQFVLKQAKKKAEIRVKEGRAKPIDWLAVTLRVIDPTRDLLDEDASDAELEIVDPDGVFEGLNEIQLHDLERDIETYITLETNQNNREFWNVSYLATFPSSAAKARQTMKTICKDRRQRSKTAAPENRVVSSVLSDVDRLLGPKTYDDLEILEKQIKSKLDSNEPIDVDYWEQLLRSLSVWKARAKLKHVYQSVIDSRLRGLRKQQEEEARLIREKLALILEVPRPVLRKDIGEEAASGQTKFSLEAGEMKWSPSLDPEPLLRLRTEDKGLGSIDEREFLDKLVWAHRV